MDDEINEVLDCSFQQWYGFGLSRGARRDAETLDVLLD
jgi:hypothetical protein